MNKGICGRLLALGIAALLASSAIATENLGNTNPPAAMETPKETTAATQAPIETKSVVTTEPVETASAETKTPAETKTAETTAPAETKAAQTEAPSDTAVPTSTVTATPEETAAPVPDSTETANTENTDAPDAMASPGVTGNPDGTADPNATDNPNAAMEPGVPLNERATITAFAPLAMTEAAVAVKPALTEVQAQLEAELTATLDDETTVRVPVAWSCADYETEALEYVFTSAMTEQVYPLAEGLAMPTFVLCIVEPSQLVSGDFVCEIRADGSLIIVGWTGTADAVAIPATLEGRTVWGVANTAFAGNQELREITVSAGVSALEEGAFANCLKLKTVNLPDSLEFAGDGLFSGSDPEAIRLNLALKTETSDGRSYHREKIIHYDDGTTSVEEIDVSIGRDFTDYTVLSGGEWSVKGNLTLLSAHTAIVSAGGLMTLEEGVTVTVFGSLACAGSCANNGVVAACSGAVLGVNGTVLREHSWQGTECSVCGAHQRVTLNAHHIAGSVSKVYDGTNAIDLGPADFVLEGVCQDDDVSIVAVSADSDSKDVGDYLVSVTLVLGGKDAEHYNALPLELSVSISKKPVTVTPREGQSKIYGESEPTLRAGYRGVVSGETLSGKLSRESGESEGKYKITMGNLAEKNPNYEIALGEGVFTIEPKALTAGSVAVAAIANQRYTGAALTPSVEVTDGGRTLKEGVDYTLAYSNNTEVGAGCVVISGKGNYTGSREAAFRIIKVGASTGSGFSASYVSGETYAEGFDDSSEEQPENRLMLGDTDYGSVLFDQDGSALTFVHYSQEIRHTDPATGIEEVAQRILHIDAQQTTDAFGIENEGDYGEPRLRLSMDLACKLMAAGYSDVYLAVGESEVRIPLATLYSEYVSSEGTLTVDAYEVRLWPLKQPLDEKTQAALGEYDPITAPVRFEILALPAEIERNEKGEYIGAEDVLSLMDGVTLMFTPADTPDYQYTEYWTICSPTDDGAAAPAPWKTVFVMDDYEVKGRVQPVFGGNYAIGVMKEVEA